MHNEYKPVHMKIELDSPNVGELEKQYLERCIDSTYISTFGPFVKEFEYKFAEYINSSYAVATQSGTSALHMSLYELGIGKGDEVICPVVTFVATANPIIYVGAKPVFVDIDPQTWNIDPKCAENAITPNTKAMISVHLYGNPCNMDALCNMSKKYGISLIEDATESLGAVYRDQMTGSFGDFGVFSFNGNKIITTGGGGMIVTDKEESAKHIKFLINQARDESKGYYHPEVGFNYRMTNLEASLGLSQLKRINQFIVKKVDFAKIYKEYLSDIDGIDFQQEYEHSKSSWWLTSIKIPPNESISRIHNTLKLRGIPTRRIFNPIVEFAPYRKLKSDTYRNAYELYEKGLSLPSSTVNTCEQIEKVCEEIRHVFKA